MSALVTRQISPLSTRLPRVKSEFANGISPAVRPIPSSCLGGGLCGGEEGEVGAGPAAVAGAHAVFVTVKKHNVELRRGWWGARGPGTELAVTAASPARHGCGCRAPRLPPVQRRRTPGSRSAEHCR